jgi:hypothetical protein
MQLDPVQIHFRSWAVLAVVAAAVTAGCATARLASGWAPDAVMANGSADDWADKQTCSTMKDGLQLSVANDAERLYVMAKFRANDPNWSRAAAVGGLTLRVTGPRKRTMSFRLPKGPERAGLPGGFGRPQESMPRSGRMPFPADPMQAEFEGKLVVTDIDKNEIPVATDGSQGPAAGFSDENGMCVYEFSIPLQDTAFGHYSLDARAGADLGVTVTAGVSAEARKAMREQMGTEGPPEGGGMRPGGGEAGGGRPQGPGGFGGGPGRGGQRGGPPGGQAAANPSVSLAVRLAVGP